MAVVGRLEAALDGVTDAAFVARSHGFSRRLGGNDLYSTLLQGGSVAGVVEMSVGDEHVRGLLELEAPAGGVALDIRQGGIVEVS